MSWHTDSGNLLISRIDSGIQLSAPEISSSGVTVNQLLALPFSTWFLDKTGVTVAINDEGIDVCGFGSLENALGHSIETVSQTKSSRVLIDNCMEVMQLGETRMYEEKHIRKDGVTLQFLSIKSPLYNSQHVIIGVCGFSIVLGRHPLADSLNMLSQLALLGTSHSPTHSRQDSLSKLNLPQRERQCLELIMRGYTAKMIARHLELSFRTVESYIVTLKRRLGVNSKTELIAILDRATLPM